MVLNCDLSSGILSQIENSKTEDSIWARIAFLYEVVDFLISLIQKYGFVCVSYVFMFS